MKSTIAAALLLLGAVSVAAAEYAKTDGTFTQNRGMIGGRQRSYYLYEPRNLKAGAPLVFVFHGGGGDGGAAREGTGAEFEMLADRYGFVVAYPDGIGRNWNG